MSEDLIIAAKNASRKEKYEVLLPQLHALVEGEEPASPAMLRVEDGSW